MNIPSGAITAAADAMAHPGTLLPDSASREQYAQAALEAALPAIQQGYALPGMSTVTSDEQAYQYDAARSLLVSVRALRRAADRIEDAARLMVEGVPTRGYFPNAGLVRVALSEIRNMDALVSIDSALESAMLADRERAATAQHGAW